MPVSVNTVIKRRRDTEANWIANNPTLQDGEQAFSTDVKDFKMGPGAWNDLEYWMQSRNTNSQIKVLINANPFTYDTAYDGSDYIPNRWVELDTGGGVFQFYQSYPTYDPSTGIVTTDAWDGSSVMYLVID